MTFSDHLCYDSRMSSSLFLHPQWRHHTRFPSFMEDSENINIPWKWEVFNSRWRNWDLFYNLMAGIVLLATIQPIRWPFLNQTFTPCFASFAMLMSHKRYIFLMLIDYIWIFPGRSSVVHLRDISPTDLTEHTRGPKRPVRLETRKRRLDTGKRAANSSQLESSWLSSDESLRKKCKSYT